MTDALIVTPVYCTPENRRFPLLLQTIYWIQQQEGDFVHVVVDDGSTDDSAEKLDYLADELPRFRVLHQSNQGSSTAINQGVKVGMQEFSPSFITYCHSDDVFLPESVIRRVNAARSRNARFVFSDMYSFREPDKVTELKRAPRIISMSQGYYDLLRRNIRRLPYSTMMWSSELFNQIEGFDPRITSAEDWDIALRTVQVLEDTEHTYLEQPTVAVRKHDNNLCQENIRNGNKLRCYSLILSKHLKGRYYYSELFKLWLRLKKETLPPNILKALVPLKRMICGTTKKESRKVDFVSKLDVPDYTALLGL